jgi:trimeric autotransporter adhesin
MLCRLRFLALALALGALATFAIGCGTTHSNMRFVHASPDAPNVDLAVDGKIVASNLPFATVFPGSSYLSISAGGRLIEVRPTGTAGDLVDASNVSFSTHKQYTVFFTGLVTQPPNPPPCTVTPPAPNQTINLVTDDNSAPQSGNIKLRVFHGSPCAPANLDIYIVAPGTAITNLSPTIPGLPYQQASSYQSVAPTSNEVIMTATGDPTKFRLVDQTYTLTAGQIRTLVVLDVTGGGAISATPLVLADLN